MAQPDSYAHLLSSNVPIPAETTSVQKNVDIANTKIKKLKSDLLKLEGDLQQHQAALSPVRCIPLEVLGEIFLHSLPTIMGHEARCLLVALSLVCRRWRNAALCTHRLWAGVQVGGSCQVSFEKLTEWFKRSGAAPRTLDFDMCRSGYVVCRESATSCEANTAILARLLEYGPTLDCLSLQFQTIRCLEKLYEEMGKNRSSSGSKSTSMSGSWLSIRSIGLEFHRQQGFPATAAEAVFSRLPPDLKSFQLDLRGDAHPWFLIVPAFTLMPLQFVQHLTSLSFSCNWDKRHFYHILDQCSGLESLTLNLHVHDGFFSTSDENPSPRSAFHLPNLHTLTLQKTTPPGLNLLLLLHAPALVSLIIQAGPTQARLPHEPVVGFDLGKVSSFLDQSQCQDTFRSLSINEGCFEAGRMERLLCGLPTLSHLVLDKVQLDYAELFRRLSLRDGPTRHRLPQLKILELRQIPPSFDFNHVAQFIFCRKRRDWNLDGPAVDEADSLREVIVTYSKSTSGKSAEMMQKKLDDTVIETLMRAGCILLNVGPREYDEACYKETHFQELLTEETPSPPLTFPNDFEVGTYGFTW